MRKTLGYICLILSFVTWGVVPILPFIDIPQGVLITATTIIIISGEVLFVTSIALLGKEVWNKIKGFFKRKK